MIKVVISRKEDKKFSNALRELSEYAFKVYSYYISELGYCGSYIDLECIMDDIVLDGILTERKCAAGVQELWHKGYIVKSIYPDRDYELLLGNENIEISEQ